MIVDYEHVVAQPVEQVFPVMADIGRRPEWVPIAGERNQATEGPIGVGSKYRARDRYLGWSVEFVHEITVFERNQLLVESWSGLLPGGMSTRFEDDNGSTRLTVRTVMDPPGVMKLLTPLMKVWLRRVFEQAYVRFEHLVAEESRSGEEAGSAM